MKTTAFRPHASALLLVLWALLLLSATVFAWVQWMQESIAAHSAENREMEARAMAHSGLAVGLHPLASAKTPLPGGRIAPGQDFRVEITGEGGRLNLNWLLRGEEPGKLTILRQWLERRGLDYEQRDQFIDGLLDYADADHVRRLNGHEEDGEYHPANRELRSVEELARVRGAAPLTAQRGWQDHLTVHSLGPIDLNSAPIEVLQLLPGLGETRLRHFVEYRRGPDHLDGTPDDNSFPDLSAIQQFLKLTAGQFQELRPLISYQDPTMHIRSAGRSGNVTRLVEVIARKGADKLQIFSWKE